MKKIIYITLAAAVLAATSCSKKAEFDVNNDISGQSITLRFSAGDLATRADGDEEETANNESCVKRIDYFIFPVGTDGNVADTTEYVLSRSITPAESKWLECSYTDTFEPGLLGRIFPNGASTAMVFAVANFVDATGVLASIPETVKTWKDLHELEVGPTFYKNGGAGFGMRWPHPKATTDDSEAGINDDLFFVMTGEKEIKLASGAYAVDEVIPLERLASKVTVEFSFEEVTDSKGIKWIPQDSADEARVYLSNAISHSMLGGPLTRTLEPDGAYNNDKYTPKPNRDIFEYAYDFLNDFKSGELPYYYTYPISMEEGDDNQPYLKLVLPWYGYKNLAGDGEEERWVFYKQKEVYYKIVLPRNTINLGNKIYEYKVNVNIIGSDKEVQVTGEQYIVKNWLSNNAISNNVATGQYISLDIPKDDYDMYGSSVEILFVSSGEVEISKLQIYTLDYSEGAPEEEYFINGTPTSYVSPYSASTTDSGNPAVTLPNWVKISGTQLVINHTMNTNINSSDVDIAPYHFIVTLHLIDAEDDTFDRHVHITQYPPIYVSTIQSASNTVFLNGEPYGTGTVYNNDGWTGIGLGSIGGGQVTGTTLTVVTVTTLASLDTTPYTTSNIGTPTIGDSRIPLSGNYISDSVSGDSWGTDDLGSSENNYIANYQYAGTSYKNFIAPKLMLASGYGANTGKGSWVRNAERCAAYQENGYPAGRWRLPTEAEILFVYTLANKGLIPQPFQGSGYWANTGRYYLGGFYDNDGNRSVRCVYDLWYWGDDKLSNTTEWGGFQTDYINE